MLSTRAPSPIDGLLEPVGRPSRADYGSDRGHPLPRATLTRETLADAPPRRRQARAARVADRRRPTALRRGDRGDPRHDERIEVVARRARPERRRARADARPEVVLMEGACRSRRFERRARRFQAREGVSILMHHRLGTRATDPSTASGSGRLRLRHEDTHSAEIVTGDRRSDARRATLSECSRFSPSPGA